MQLKVEDISKVYKCDGCGMLFIPKVPFTEVKHFCKACNRFKKCCNEAAKARKHHSSDDFYIGVD